VAILRWSSFLRGPEARGSGLTLVSTSSPDYWRDCQLESIATTATAQKFEGTRARPDYSVQGPHLQTGQAAWRPQKAAPVGTTAITRHGKASPGRRSRTNRINNCQVGRLSSAPSLHPKVAWSGTGRIAPACTYPQRGSRGDCLWSRQQTAGCPRSRFPLGRRRPVGNSLRTRPSSPVRRSRLKREPENSAKPCPMCPREERPALKGTSFAR